ncbi:MAG: hypothetical protein F6K40_11190 [Okeania sp. SIO3I5]|uniref:hypothetical protein n=1 Tax=Okeania sp. SIO3I5 TaxID=2607805 RepID=UPI0013B9BCC4|nr:hypothetical protein [Okeania sp. SIO3I5]NEQ36810.1 hypothetical protein [Okeania sp. SIO3I5]
MASPVELVDVMSESGQMSASQEVYNDGNIKVSVRTPNDFKLKFDPEANPQPLLGTTVAPVLFIVAAVNPHVIISDVKIKFIIGHGSSDDIQANVVKPRFLVLFNGESVKKLDVMFLETFDGLPYDSSREIPVEVAIGYAGGRLDWCNIPHDMCTVLDVLPEYSITVDSTCDRLRGVKVPNTIMRERKSE